MARGRARPGIHEVAPAADAYRRFRAGARGAAMADEAFVTPVSPLAPRCFSSSASPGLVLR
jgi:hypothetical protein